MANRYCEVLGIAVRSLEAVRGHREAGTFSLMLVALVERGAPITLLEIAQRFAAAKIHDSADAALAALRKCRPERPPVYRDGDGYALDPHDADLDLWMFRLGLRPQAVSVPVPPRAPPTPRPPETERLSVAELDAAWRDASLNQWSAQRLVLAVLDAHGRAMPPDAVIASLSPRARRGSSSPHHRARRFPVRADSDRLVGARGPARRPGRAARDHAELTRAPVSPSRRLGACITSFGVHEMPQNAALWTRERSVRSA